MLDKQGEVFAGQGGPIKEPIIHYDSLNSVIPNLFCVL